MTTMYLTKYCLTKGKIEKVEANEVEKCAKVEGSYNLYRIDIEIFYTVDAAIAKAEEMRIKKLQSLDKQIKKFSALKFKIDGE